MIGIRTIFDAAPLLNGLRALHASLDDELSSAFGEIGEVIVSDARGDHPYVDRTGTLTRRTRTYAPRGRFSRGDLRVEIVAATEYATHVMRRRGDWLDDSMRRQQGRVDHHVADALERAVRRSGLV